MTEVAVMTLLLSKLNKPENRQTIQERAAYALRSKYPDVVVGEEQEEWCDGLCGVCEKDCDTAHDHNFESHRPGKHLIIFLYGDIDKAEEVVCSPQ